MKVGLLGGTFNPPHVGHLVCAMEARAQLGLDVVRLVPVGQASHKVVAPDPGAGVRAELCELAARSEPGLEVSRIEVDRPGTSYTVDTLRVLADSGDDLTFIVGGDQAQSLQSWREPETVLSLARLAVAERSGVRRQDILDALGPLDRSRVVFFDMPRLDIASSDLRRRVAAGRPIRHLVPEAVRRRIEDLDLYDDEVVTA